MTKIPTMVSLSYYTKTILSYHMLQKYGNGGTSFRVQHQSQQQRILLPVMLLIVLVFVSMLHSHQIALLLLPSYECSTCWILPVYTQQQHKSKLKLRRRNSIVTYNEFFHRGPSMEVVQQFFLFDEELYVHQFYNNNNNNNSATIATNFQFHPLWWHNSNTSNSNSNDESYTDRNANKDIETQDLTQKNHKLIFIHTSRTAGTTIRAILRAYANQHNKTILSIQRCWDLNYEFMDTTDTWRNGRYANPRINTAYLDCLATLYYHGRDVTPTTTTTISSTTSAINDSTSQDSAERSNDKNRNDRVSSLYLNENAIDIVSGQIPLGCDENWFYEKEYSNNNSNSTKTGSQHEHVNTRYVVFFRHPMEQFVSEFVIRTWKEDDGDDTRSVDDIVQQIQEVLIKANQERSYYEPLSSHALITPKQMAWVERQSNILWTPERRINVTKQNLIHYTNRLLIGLVERMPESLLMLQYLIDPYNQSNSLFKYFTTQSSHLVEVQRSLDRTRAIVTIIHDDIVLRSMVEEYIKYEVQIYSLAVQIHDRQYRWFQTSRPY